MYKQQQQTFATVRGIAVLFMITARIASSIKIAQKSNQCLFRADVHVKVQFGSTHRHRDNHVHRHVKQLFTNHDLQLPFHHFVLHLQLEELLHARASLADNNINAHQSIVLRPSYKNPIYCKNRYSFPVRSFCLSARIRVFRACLRHFQQQPTSVNPGGRFGPSQKTKKKKKEKKEFFFKPPLKEAIKFGKTTAVEFTSCRKSLYRSESGWPRVQPVNSSLLLQRTVRAPNLTRSHKQCRYSSRGTLQRPKPLFILWSAVEATRSAKLAA